MADEQVAMTEGERIADRLLAMFYIDPFARRAVASHIDAALDAQRKRFGNTLRAAGKSIAIHRDLIVRSETTPGADIDSMPPESLKQARELEELIGEIEQLMVEPNGPEVTT